MGTSLTGATGVVGGDIVVPNRGLRRSAQVFGSVMVAALVAAGGVVGAVAWSARHVATVSEGRLFDVGDVAARPIAMVLGAKAYAGRPSAFLAARLDLAVQLYGAGTIRAVLVSGDNRSGSNHETTVMRDYLVKHGVPANKVVQDPAGFDTYDSCVRARDVFGVTDMIVVTQRYHLGRTITICSEVGVDATGVGDVTARERYPVLYAKGESREWAANIKMEWDLLSRRAPQQDPFDDSLLRAAGV